MATPLQFEFGMHFYQ